MPAVLTLQIQDNVDECLNMPSQIARKPGSDSQNEVFRHVPHHLLWYQAVTCCTTQFGAADHTPYPTTSPVMTSTNTTVSSCIATRYSPRPV